MSLSWLREHRRAPSPVPRRQREVAMCETRRRKHVPMPVIALLLLALPAFIVPAGNRSSAFPSRNAPTATQPAHRQSSTESYGKLPLSFEANQGQTDPRVKFLSRGSGYTLFLTGDEAVLALRSRQSSVVSSQLQKTTDHAQRTTDTLRMKLVGANQAARVTALEELPGKSNYFIGNDPKQWRADVPTYGKVKYEGVYPGINLVYYGNQRQLEYDFVVAPGADPKAIALKIETGKSKIENRKAQLRVDASGDLVVEADGTEVRFHKPVVYQPKGSLNSEFRIQNSEFIEGRYVL